MKNDGRRLYRNFVVYRKVKIDTDVSVRGTVFRLRAREIGKSSFGVSERKTKKTKTK